MDRKLSITVSTIDQPKAFLLAEEGYLQNYIPTNQTLLGATLCATIQGGFAPPPAPKGNRLFQAMAGAKKTLLQCHQDHH